MKRAAIVLLAAPALALAVEGGGIMASKHNLSVSGPGPIKARTETQVCKFCHVGHSASTHGNNRPEPRSVFQPYRSSTMASAPGRPSGSTRLCLSCHDGTIAIGDTLTSGRIEMNEAAPGGRIPPQRTSNIGTDLRRTHPVSFRPAPGPELRAPQRRDAVHLDARGEMQCTACHDPHEESIDPVARDFLRKSNEHSGICVTCHTFRYWATNPSAHESSTAPTAAQRGPSLPYPTVAQNACIACHASHGASDTGQLLRTAQGEGEDALCLSCHSGQVARINVGQEAGRPESHSSPELNRGHDPAEQPFDEAHQLPEKKFGAARHAACVDCHDPHSAYSREAKAPFASGALAGVWGIDRNGARVDPAQYEYEICFKCHADSVNQPQRNGPRPPESVRRAVTEVNLRRVFEASAPSSHPVEGPGHNPDVPSLVAPLTPSSVIYCSDCHASSAGAGAGRGPHGSSYPHILERNLTTLDRTVESPEAYALCYKCHDRTVLLSDRSAFKLHKQHVVDNATPCTACHDWHGVSSVAGNPVNNAHLVDFDVSIAQPAKSGLRRYTSLGPRRGNCSVSCHGANHEEAGY